MGGDGRTICRSYRGRHRRGKGCLGSRFILDDNGTIVTFFHVVSRAQSGRVVFHKEDAREVLGFLAASPGSDLALLRTSLPDKVSPVKLSEEVPPKGMFVYTVGSPEGLIDSISDGIVSAVRTGEEIGEQLSEHFEILVYSPFLLNRGAGSGDPH